MAKEYEVQTSTIIDGWVNTWTENDEPLTFPSTEKAQEAIDEFFDDVKEAGLEGYEREDYRIVRK